jgi:hypothetical protein
LENRPTSWQQYLNQFCDPSRLSRPTAYGYIKTYLQTQFRLTFETRQELERLASEDEVASLTEALAKEKANPALAKNDALVALAVYGRREALKEYAEASEFGYRTWWLTGESTILKYTAGIVRAHHGERYMMRPEFLLHFIGLAPSVAEVRRSYANVFPSVLGIRLGRRMDPASFQKLLEQVEAAQQLEEGARKARVAQIVDQLKAEFRRS